MRSNNFVNSCVQLFPANLKHQFKEVVCEGKAMFRPDYTHHQAGILTQISRSEEV
jgi:hypothetical protein